MRPQFNHQLRRQGSELLTDPERVRAGLEEMIERERNGSRGDPDREARAWAEKLAEADRMRVGYQELAATGLMTLAELVRCAAQGVGEHTQERHA